MNTYHFTTTSKTILGDLYTPVAAYMRLRDIYPQSALMESSDYHDASNSRSFIGIHPIASVAVSHGVATVTFPDGNNENHEITKNYGTAEAIHTLIDQELTESADLLLTQSLLGMSIGTDRTVYVVPKVGSTLACHTFDVLTAH